MRPDCGAEIFKTPCCKDEYCPVTLTDYLLTLKFQKEAIDPPCGNTECGKKIDMDKASEFSEKITNQTQKIELRKCITERFRSINKCPGNFMKNRKTQIQKHKNTKTQKHKNIKTQKHKNTNRWPSDSKD